jgi:Fic family protein
MAKASYKWKPIADLPDNWPDLAVPELPPLFKVWSEQAATLKDSSAFKTFMERMRREIAIETGIIERLYTLDRGITQLLIEHGLDEALIPHGASDQPANTVIAMIRDQEAAVEGLFDFVTGRRALNTSYIKELHALLTRHQPTIQGVTETGDPVTVPLLRGDWKKWPNNPLRPNGDIHEYCPPEQVASEMDNLIRWHLEHQDVVVPPEVEAAWLHHRFTQIHPFQDGNGRVARCLSTLVFIQAGWFPLVIRDRERSDYIRALEDADAGDLRPLIQLFTLMEKHAFIHSLSLSDEVLSEGRQSRAIIVSVAERLKKRKEATLLQHIKIAEQYADHLMGIARERLRAVAKEINTSLNRKKAPIAFVTEAANKSAKGDWRGYQITVAAKQLHYYPNRRDFSSWVGLRIGLRPLTNIVLAFHVPGPKYFGVLVCLGTAYRSTREESKKALAATDIEALSSTPFQFSYADEMEELESRFRTWLEEVVINGLNYWQSEI